ncbi:MAG: hypothetical protein WA728_10370, partial [Xanthobacteraceae bacterium]
KSEIHLPLHSVLGWTPARHSRISAQRGCFEDARRPRFCSLQAIANLKHVFCVAGPAPQNLNRNFFDPGEGEATRGASWLIRIGAYIWWAVSGAAVSEPSRSPIRLASLLPSDYGNIFRAEFNQNARRCHGKKTSSPIRSHYLSREVRSRSVNSNSNFGEPRA